MKVYYALSKTNRIIAVFCWNKPEKPKLAEIYPAFKRWIEVSLDEHPKALDVSIGTYRCELDESGKVKSISAIPLEEVRDLRKAKKLYSQDA